MARMHCCRGVLFCAANRYAPPGGKHSALCMHEMRSTHKHSQAHSYTHKEQQSSLQQQGAARRNMSPNTGDPSDFQIGRPMSAVSPEDGGLLLTTVKGLLFAADMQKRALLDAPTPAAKTRAPVSGVTSSAATDQLMSIMRAGSTQGMDPCVDMQLRSVLE
eukprot:5010-Heterococcus_DN1.PRE.3